MKSKEKKFLAILIASLVMVLLFTPREDKLEWAHTYMREDTRAYGSRILYEELRQLHGEHIVPVDIPPYEAVQDTALRNVTYLFLNDFFMPDDNELASLLRFVSRGNMLLISAETIADEFMAQIGVEPNTYFPGVELLGVDTSFVNLVNPALHQEGGFYYGSNIGLTYLEPVADSSQTDLLGVYQDGKANYVRAPHGQGWIYVHTAPLAFTNYNMLEGNGGEYAFKALSYLFGVNNASEARLENDAQPRIWWDAYYKPFRVEVRTPLRYILSSPVLRVAYILACIGLLLFVFFHGKRKQRPIPIDLPERNTTVAFAETVAQLYFHQGDHAGLAHKMIEQFRHYARSKLQLTAGTVGDLVPEIVSGRSGVEIDKVASLLDEIKAVEQKQAIDAVRLQHLAKQFDAFYTDSVR